MSARATLGSAAEVTAAETAIALEADVRPLVERTDWGPVGKIVVGTSWRTAW